MFAFVFLVGELFLFSGQFREEMAGNEVASFCAFIALIFNVVFVGILIKGIIKSAEERKEKLKEQKDKTKYQITFDLEKSREVWELRNLNEIDRQKIHGLY